VTLRVIATIAFVLFQLLLGDPTYGLLDPSFPPNVRGLLRQRFRLDRPTHPQYVHFLVNVARGDFGRSFFYHQPAILIVWGKLLKTLILAGTAFASVSLKGDRDE